MPYYKFSCDYGSCPKKDIEVEKLMHDNWARTCVVFCKTCEGKMRLVPENVKGLARELADLKTNAQKEDAAIKELCKLVKGTTFGGHAK